MNRKHVDEVPANPAVQAFSVDRIQFDDRWLQRVRQESLVIRAIARRLDRAVSLILAELGQKVAAEPSGDTTGAAAFEIPARSPDFGEDLYLHFNPDVAASVASGAFSSGYEHWLLYGHKEGRGGGPAPQLADRSQFLSRMEQRPFGVNLFGYLSDPAGLGSAARGLRDALLASGIPMHAIDLPPWRSREEVRNPLPAYWPYRINLLVLNVDILPLFVKAYGEEVLLGCYNIGYWLWELPSMRADWQQFQGYLDEIWGASEFCREAFGCTATVPVRRIPLVVDGLEKKAVYGREHFGIPEGVLVFGYVFDVSSYMDRKNPLALVQAFRGEFGESQEALLLLKYLNAGVDPESLRQLQEAIGGASNIRTMSGILSEEENVSLHQVMDCLVSPHRSEGFGLNLVESMYFGRAVVATGYSANVDYTHEGNSYVVKYRLKPIERTAGPYVKDSVWAEPDVMHLGERMREAFEDRAGREARGKRAAAEVREWFSAAAVGRQMRERFRELGLEKRLLDGEKLRRRRPEAMKLYPEGAPEEVKREIRGWARKPLISVVTPVFNVGGEYLRACIESVRGQWYPFWELCLCDDASTDQGTLGVLEEYRGLDPRIKIVRSGKNLGIAGASNRCAEISTGEYLAMLDNDDEITADALYEIGRALNGNPDIDLLYTDKDAGPVGQRGILVVRKQAFYRAGECRDGFSLKQRILGISNKSFVINKTMWGWSSGE